MWINLNTIRSNFEKIVNAVGPLDVMAVLKADAYGLGVRAIAQCLLDAGATRFGVADLQEALAIDDFGIPVQVLGGIIADEIPGAVANDIVCPITDLQTAGLLSAEARNQGKSVRCHFLIDTGMGRLGILLAEAHDLIRAVVDLPGLDCTGIYSHFPFAYGDYDFSCHQVAAFARLLGTLADSDIHFQHVHMANSDGIHNIESAVASPFTMVRTGINLYGCFDLEGRKTLPLEEVLTLKSRIVSIRDLPWGASIGYGRTHCLDRPTRVGTVSIGYADGLPLSMSDCGSLIVRGRKCPILGRVSMDYTTISLEGVPSAEVGDEVICLGEEISVADWARNKDTITYEIICSFGNRVKRRYIKPTD